MFTFAPTKIISQIYKAQNFRLQVLLQTTPSNRHQRDLKMKFFVFFFVAFFVAAQALTTEERETVKKYYGECYTETGADRTLTMKAKAGDFNFDDEKVKEFFFCMQKKVGIMDESGTFLREAAIAKVAEKDRVDANRALDICLTKKGTTHTESAWNYAKCYDAERPGQEDFF